MRRLAGHWIAGSFALLTALPFLGKAYHVDEPFFLAGARHALAEPASPFAFEYNWYGRGVPFAEINNTPPLIYGLLAAAWRLTGGSEAAMRACLLPFDLLAALALFALAGRFLKEPLGPTLTVLAGPAYLINMGHLMPEKPALALAFAALYALVRAADEGRRGWLWASAGLFALAGLAKYSAAFLLAPALAYAWSRGVKPGRLAAYAAASLSGPLLYLAADRLGSGAALDAASRVLEDSSRLLTSSPSHALRSGLAFTGGCAAAASLWCVRAHPTGRAALAAFAGAAALLFLPALDLAPVVRPVDRLTGAALAFLALWGLWGALVRGRGLKGWALWAPWLVSVLGLCALYWSVMARLVLLAMPALVFASAEALEARLKPARLRPLYAASVAATAALSLALGWVDHRYAAAQKDFAREVLSERASGPGRVWCASPWGLRHYLEEGGAHSLDFGRRGWGDVRPGDLVVHARASFAVPARPASLRAKVRTTFLPGPLPLRLISGWVGEGGFYSNVWGFLPFSLSSEPLEEFSTVEAL